MKSHEFTELEKLRAPLGFAFDRPTYAPTTPLPPRPRPTRPGASRPAQPDAVARLVQKLKARA